MPWFPLLLACAAPAPGTTPGPTGTVPGCDAGTIWDGTACVAERCGTDPFPDGSSDAVYVAAGSGWGDGTLEHPLATIAEAMAAAGSGGSVVVAAGTYNEIVAFEDATAGITVRGRCPELVVVDGAGLDPDSPLVYTYGGPGRRWTLGGVAVTNGAYGGVWALDGTLVLDTMLISGNQLLGLGVGDSDGGSLEAEGVEITDTLPHNREGGYGLYVIGGSRAEVRDAVIARNQRANVVVHDPGSDLTLVDVTVRDVVPATGQTVGIDVNGGAALVATGLLAEENPGITLEVGDGSSATVTASVISGARDPDGTGGLGVLVSGGSLLTVDGLAVRDCDAGGVQITDSTVAVTGLEIDGIHLVEGFRSGVGMDLAASAGTLTDVWITGADGGALEVFGGSLAIAGLTVTGGGDHGLDARGVEVSDSARVDFTDLAIADATDLGLAVYGSEVSVTGGAIVGTVTRDGEGGIGLYAEDGSTVSLTDLSITDNRAVGLYLSDPGTVGMLDGVSVGLTRTDGSYLFGRGVELHDGATLDAVSSVFSGNQEVGLYVGDGGSRATLDHVTIEGTVPSPTYTTGFGMVVQGDAIATLDSVVVQGNSGPGLYAVYGGAIDAFETTVLGNGFAGGVVWDGSIVARDCDFTGTEDDPSHGGGFGIYGVGGPGSSVRLEDVIVSGNRYAGLWLTGPGTWSVVDTDIMGGGGVETLTVKVNGNAIYATGGAEVVVEGGWLRHSRTALLLDGATATVTDAVFEDNQIDVRQQGCGTVAPVSAPDATTIDRCPAVEELAAPLDFRLTIAEVEAR